MENHENIRNIADRIRKDIRANITDIEKLAGLYKETKLNGELIELYRTEFYYTLNPNCFEKIGDIYFEENNYEEALNSYLNCAECSENNYIIFEKLASVFEKLNDTQSRLICLEKASVIKGENG